MEPEVAPAQVPCDVDGPGLLRLLELVGHVGPVPAVLPPDQGVAVGVDGLAVGGDEEPGAVAPGVVVVEIGLGDPVSEHDLGHVLALDHVGLEGVPVVVVARVLVVEPGLVDPLVLGAQGLLVPVCDHDLAVGVEARHHEVDDVVQDTLGLLVLPAQEVEGQLGGHLGAPDLRGVEAHGLADDGLALRQQSLHIILGEAPGIADLQVDLSQMLQVLQVLGRGDHNQEEWIALGRGAHLHDLDLTALIL